jgi:hypothetical protein
MLNTLNVLFNLEVQKSKNLVVFSFWLPLEVQKRFKNLNVVFRPPKNLKTWGLVYVVVCVAFKVEVMTLPILGGLFQVYIGALRIWKDRLFFQKIIMFVRSCVPLCS